MVIYQAILKNLKRFVRNKIELDVVLTQKKVNPVIQFIDKKFIKIIS